MHPFQYLRPATLDECFDALDEHGEQAELLAGGTDLLIGLKAGTKRPRCVVDIKRLPELVPGIRRCDGTVEIGGRTSMQAAAMELPHVVPALAEAAAVVGSLPIRNRATLAGNIAQASPSAEIVPALVALNATIELWSRGSTRLSPILPFLLGPHQTDRRPDEILSRIHVPVPGPGESAAYLRFTPRRAIDIAVVNVGVFLRLSADGWCEDCRIALGAVAPTVIRAEQAENALRGERLTSELLSAASEVAMTEVKPIDDVRGSARYRRELVRVLVQRAAVLALQRNTRADGNHAIH